jgi:hypothetical protein
MPVGRRGQRQAIQTDKMCFLMLLGKMIDILAAEARICLRAQGGASSES